MLLPAIKFAPVLYTYRLKARIGRWYARLGAVEREVAGQPDAARIGDHVARLDAIEREIKATRLPNWMSEQTYLLRAAIDLVRERLGTPQAKAIPGLRDRAARRRGCWKARRTGVTC